MKLVIVESPTKAKTISRFLGKEYAVTSSYGHVRDLPKSKLGVDVEHDFTPQYVIPTKARKRVGELKREAAKADAIILATDEDREGEAIAWHIAQVLDLGPDAKQRMDANAAKKPTADSQHSHAFVDSHRVQRIVFHEITERAIAEALAHPRDVDMARVDAQQARRVLDRLVGYNLSPFLWKKVARGLSAGRVQSVAVRLIAERERERQAFTPQEYWTITAQLVRKSKIQNPNAKTFEAILTEKDGAKLEKFDLTNESSTKEILGDLDGAAWRVAAVEEKERSLSPPQPFRTSTLQQEAWRRLRFSAKQTMRLAQGLYEGVEIAGESAGLITYMRTDSVALSEDFLISTQRFLKDTFGEQYDTGVKRYKTKARGAQEAHEAIRPTDVAQTPENLEGKIDARAWRLYDLIWRRAVASQMPAARFHQAGVTIDASGRAHRWGFRATGSTMTFDGFTRVWLVKREDVELPALAEGDDLHCEKLVPAQHFTEPPPRFSEATLVKALEENGIGRPSTYAPTISTIQDRGYIEKDEHKRLTPTQLGFTVNDILVEHFPEIVDVSFTAKMEEELDEIAESVRAWKTVLREFWLPFSKHLSEKVETVERARPESVETNERCDKCGKPMVQKFGRFGPFFACSGFPECRSTKPLPEERTGIACPKCGKGEIIPRRSRRGKRFFGCSAYPDCDFVAWDQPINEFCPDCKSILTKTFKGLVKCSNKECKYKGEANQPRSIPT